MSAQENKAVVHKLYDDFGKGNIVEILNALTEDVVWIEPEAGRSPVAGVARGREEVAEFFRILDEVAETEAFEPREYVAQGDKVIALGSYRFRVRASGKYWESEWAMAFTLSDGRISHFRFYGDTAAEAAAFE
jgi:ketosteroid isomerase-like protein